MGSNNTDLDDDYHPDAASNGTIAIVFGTVILIGLIVFFLRGGTLMGVGTMTWWG
jgi:hypothetical protein